MERNFTEKDPKTDFSWKAAIKKKKKLTTLKLFYGRNFANNTPLNKSFFNVILEHYVHIFIFDNSNYNNNTHGNK